MFSLSSYLKDLDKTSVFDETIFNKTIDLDSGAYKIIIESEEPRALSDKSDRVYVIGVIKGGITLNTNANWGELELDSAIGSLIANRAWKQMLLEGAKVVTAVGGLGAESDLQSKKFYTGGSHMALPLTLRVLDDDESGKAIKAALALISLTLPRSNMQVKMKDAVAALINSLPSQKVADQLSKAVDFIDNGLSAVGDTIQNALPPKANKFLSNIKRQVSDEEIRLTESPPTVQITIGNWLSLYNMVIDSVSCNFSEHMNLAGPNYVDLELQVSTRYKMILNEFDGIRNVALRNGSNQRVYVSQSSGKFA